MGNLQNVWRGQPTKCVAWTTYKMCGVDNIQNVWRGQPTKCVAWTTYKMCGVDNLQTSNEFERKVTIPLCYFMVRSVVNWTIKFNFSMYLILYVCFCHKLSTLM